MLPSARVFIRSVLPATLIAWRAYELAPEYSSARLELGLWSLSGTTILAICGLWELARWGQRMDNRYRKQS